MAVKTFTAGAPLLAADINTNLMNQSVIVTTAAHTSLPTAVEGMMIYETDTDKLLQYTTATTGWQPPWNLPWGPPVPSVLVNAGPTSGTTVLTCGTLASFTPPANRRFRAYFNSSLTFGTANADIFDTLFKDNGVAIANSFQNSIHTASQYEGGCWSISTEFTLTAAAHVMTYTVGRASGTGVATIRGTFGIEDIGPSAAPA